MTKTYATNTPLETNLNQDTEELHSKLAARHELYSELQKGLDDIKAGRTITLEEFSAMMDKKFERYGFK